MFQRLIAEAIGPGFSYTRVIFIVCIEDRGSFATTLRWGWHPDLVLGEGPMAWSIAVNVSTSFGANRTTLP